jgi:dTDP-4-dehydrorhamnose 3,5-epimerase-like enzyme
MTYDPIQHRNKRLPKDLKKAQFAKLSDSLGFFYETVCEKKLFPRFSFTQIIELI